MRDIERLTERLSDMGFEVEENKIDLLKEAMRRAEQTIMNCCNCESVPEELEFVALDMAAGEYLLAAECRGRDAREVKSLSEGDMSVTFNDEGVEGIIDNLFKRGREEMIAFRRVKW